MPESTYTKRAAGIGTGIGMLAGAALTVLFPPTGIVIGLGVLGSAGAGAAVGAALGASSGKIADRINVVERGRVVQILGPFQVGKNSVYGTIVGDNETPHPTSLGTHKDYDNRAAYPVRILAEPESDRYLSTREVAGEDLPTWEEAIIETNPHGIIYVVDSFTTTGDGEPARIDKLQSEVEGIKAVERALRNTERRRIQAFMILLNKIDLRVDLASAEYSQLTERYRKTLLSQLVDNKSIESLLRSVLGNTTIIRVHPFCAEREKRSNFSQINQRAIKTFTDDLHARAK